MIKICKEKQIKKHVRPSSLAHFHLTNYDVCVFFVHFVEIKVENGLTWFLICFSKKKKYIIWTYVFFFLC